MIFWRKQLPDKNVTLTRRKDESEATWLRFFKYIVKGFDSINMEDFFEFDTSGSWKWREADYSCEGVFFSQRVINAWNKLPSYVVEAASVNSFKNRLDDWSMDVES